MGTRMEEGREGRELGNPPHYDRDKSRCERGGDADGQSTASVARPDARARTSRFFRGIKSRGGKRHVRTGRGGGKGHDARRPAKGWKSQIVNGTREGSARRWRVPEGQRTESSSFDTSQQRFS